MHTRMHHKTRKRFGQHFLHDPLALEDIASHIDARPSDRLLEIGPGRGALTELLMLSAPQLIAIEIDRDLCKFLRTRFPRLHLIEADVLGATLGHTLGTEDGWRLVGNLPYNISTPLLVRICALAQRIQDAWFLLQREVALRLVAEPGTRDWSRLSILVRLAFHTEMTLSLGPECFTPAPRVTSNLVHLEAKPTNERIISRSVFEDVLRQAFSQRRKTLANALARFSLDWNLMSVNPSKRPDQLGVDEYIEIANQLAASTGPREGDAS